jgi:hypothetical protein
MQPTTARTTADIALFKRDDGDFITSAHLRPHCDTCPGDCAHAVHNDINDEDADSAALPSSRADSGTDSRRATVADTETGDPRVPSNIHHRPVQPSLAEELQALAVYEASASPSNVSLVGAMDQALLDGHVSPANYSSHDIDRDYERARDRERDGARDGDRDRDRDFPDASGRRHRVNDDGGAHRRNGEVVVQEELDRFVQRFGSDCEYPLFSPARNRVTVRVALAATGRYTGPTDNSQHDLTLNATFEMRREPHDPENLGANESEDNGTNDLLTLKADDGSGDTGHVLASMRMVPQEQRFTLDEEKRSLPTGHAPTSVSAAWSAWPLTVKGILRHAYEEKTGQLILNGVVQTWAWNEALDVWFPAGTTGVPESVLAAPRVPTTVPTQATPTSTSFDVAALHLD